MPLTVSERHGKYCVVPLCDACRLPITRDGNYEWDGAEKSAPVYFSHKHCTGRLRAAHPEIDCWSSLDALPVFLASTLGVSWEEADEAAKFHEW